MSPTRVKEQFDECFLTGLEEFPVHPYSILIKNVGIFHTVYEQQLGFKFFGKGQQRKFLHLSGARLTDTDCT